MAKAKKIETYYGKYSNIVVYEYRGCRYEVEYANDFSYCCSPAWIQHKDAQEKIDKAIDKPKANSKAEPASIGLDYFFDLIEGKIEE